jgi:hypothetical protein
MRRHAGTPDGRHSGDGCGERRSDLVGIRRAVADAAPAGAPEVNPAGDIPDNQVLVPFTSPDGALVVSVPEGWARSADGTATMFTDKFNSVRVEVAPRPAAADVASARATDVPQLQASVPGFALHDVRSDGPTSATRIPAGGRRRLVPDHRDFLVVTLRTAP